MLKKLLDEELVTISPCSAAFVKSSVREGVLPRMLKEILDTRLMVKQSMKIHKNDTALQRVLHSRQLGLKLIANVTYGYTAANFSGRMPCSEVGDSVVSKGRETLERAIRMVEANEEWACKVVYGDTDSLFVQVPGRSREEAFRIGEEIVAKVTDENPEPIKLKLEKVYQPCILQTKKRYKYTTLQNSQTIILKYFKDMLVSCTKQLLAKPLSTKQKVLKRFDVMVVQQPQKFLKRAYEFFLKRKTSAK